MTTRHHWRSQPQPAERVTYKLDVSPRLGCLILLALLVLWSTGCIQIEKAVIVCEEAYVDEAAIKPGIVYADTANVHSAQFTAKTINHYKAPAREGSR
jgi:hypothetical protein